MTRAATGVSAKGFSLEAGAVPEGDEVNEHGYPKAGPFAKVLLDAASTRPEIVGLSADLADHTDMHEFARRYPDRFVNVGVAEQNLVAVASGLARAGLLPVATTFTGFLVRRAHDFTVMQAALSGLNVKLIGAVPGITQKWGSSHASYEDLAIMRTVPGLTVVEPCDASELSEATAAILAYDGPVYMRLPRVSTNLAERPVNSFRLGKIGTLKDGHDAVIFAAGIMVPVALEASAALEKLGIATAVCNVSTLKPLDVDAIVERASRCQAVVTAENHSIIGGLGDAVASAMAVNGVLKPMQMVGLQDTFPVFGSTSYLSKMYGLEPVDIVDAVTRALHGYS